MIDNILEYAGLILWLGLIVAFLFGPALLNWAEHRERRRRFKHNPHNAKLITSKRWTHNTHYPDQSDT